MEAQVGDEGYDTRRKNAFLCLWSEETETADGEITEEKRPKGAFLLRGRGEIGYNEGT